MRTETISATTLKQALEEKDKDTLFIDLHAASILKKRHIAGSRKYPLEKIENWIDRCHGKNKFYLIGTSLHRLEEAAERIEKENPGCMFYFFPHFIDAWEKAGFEFTVEHAKTSDPIHLHVRDEEPESFEVLHVSSPGGFFVKMLSNLSGFTVIGQFQLFLAFFFFVVFITSNSFLALILALWMLLSVMRKQISLFTLLNNASWNLGKKASESSKLNDFKVVGDEDL